MTNIWSCVHMCVHSVCFSLFDYLIGCLPLSTSDCSFVCLFVCVFVVLSSHADYYRRKSFVDGGINYVFVSFCADMMMWLLSITLFVITIIALMMITCVLILFLVSLNNGNVADILLNLSCVSVDLSDCLYLLLA